MSRRLYYLIVLLLLIITINNAYSFMSNYFHKKGFLLTRVSKKDDLTVPMSLHSIYSSHTWTSNLNTETSSNVTVPIALQYLHQYNDDYNVRMKVGRNEGKHPKQIDFERAQILKAIGIKEERMNLKASTSIVSSQASEVVLGILADTGVEGLEVLRNFVDGLNLPRGILIAYDEVSKEVPIETFNSFPVYIKYNSTNSGNAYMKINPSNDFTGVIFQPKFNDTFKDNFYQFGNLPLKLYHNTY